MSEKYEVEYRALIPQSIFRAMLKKGKSEFYDSFKGPLMIHDSYFCLKNVVNFKEIEMDKVDSFSLRLRQEDFEDKSEISLNTKTIKNEGDHNAWVENEVSVSSYEECAEIIKTIGFKKFFEFTKKRYQFSNGNINIFLEDIDNFGQAVEIEILTTEIDVNDAKKELIKYLETNGIHGEMIIKKSITNLLMKKLAKF